MHLKYIDHHQTFPQNDISADSIRALLLSTREIINLCMIFENRRQHQSDENSMKFGFTELSDKNDGYMKNMQGLLTDEIYTPVTTLYYLWYNGMIRPSTQSTALDGSNPECVRFVDNLPESFDWRDKNVVTDVKNQGECGSCWAFATVGSIESAYLIHSNMTKDQINLSEQELISCARSNGCHGGTSTLSFDFVRHHGLTSGQVMPYQAKDGNGCLHAPPPLAGIRGYCVRSEIRYSNQYSSEYLTDDDIRNTLVSYGPLYIGVNADRLSRNYRGGIIDDDTCSMRVNHAVLLVGYTPDSWILKNSWGKTWGEQQGYFRIARGKNMCGINTEIAYPLVV
ncbi:group 1 mite allergen-like protein [Dermatophagoides farinae]|uniref:Group 1 mite allergen-like protein n=1 Tax=Dermatophagoides farinae TaxID=6954 RepID=A0A9D4NQB8_DERFA|nr:group 1 mite allergen-like protein [Dermatophagoides farinae]